MFVALLPSLRACEELESRLQVALTTAYKMPGVDHDVVEHMLANAKALRFLINGFMMDHGQPENTNEGI